MELITIENQTMPYGNCHLDLSQCHVTFFLTRCRHRADIYQVVDALRNRPAKTNTHQAQSIGTSW